LPKAGAAVGQGDEGRGDEGQGYEGVHELVASALDRFTLDGRVAIVTGASSGLGAAAARALAGAGARVAVVARRGDRLTGLARETGALPVPADLTEDDQIASIVPRVAEALGPPVILVNAAGHFVSRDPAEDEKPDAIRATLELNLVAPFRLAQEAFPHMAALKNGSVINISSVSGNVGIPGIPQASYAASKQGLSGLTRELAVQWARHGIRVNTIAPGFFRSEITDGLYSDERSAAWLRRNTPLPGEGTPDDFAGAVLWLASEAGRYVTGQTIVIDGGWTAR
jgi:NAD(P)-dependent dehydrogenase (short-subunit alcohol dehydrogenase family)